MKKPICRTCRFFEADYDQDPNNEVKNIIEGTCHRYPADKVWPTVWSFNWCGEHQPNPPSTDKEEEKAIEGTGFTMTDDKDGDGRS